MIKKRAKRSFTLIEVIISLFLILLIGGLLTLNLKKTLVNQKFKTEVQQIVQKLRLAQNLMLITQRDVAVVFESDPQNASTLLWIETDNSQYDPWIARLSKPKYLKTIRYIGFGDELKGFPDERGKVKVRFMSKGYAMSQGVLRLATSAQDGNGVLQQFISLPGYPTFLKSQSEVPAELTAHGLDETFKRHLTTQTFNELKQMSL